MVKYQVKGFINSPHGKHARETDIYEWVGLQLEGMPDSFTEEADALTALAMIDQALGGHMEAAGCLKVYPVN